MNVDFEHLALWALGAGMGAMGWFARELWSAVQKLKDDLGRLEIRIGTDYVRYDRLQDALKPITVTLERIEQTLAGKADK